VSGEDDIDAELREMTMTEERWRDWWSDAVEYEDLDGLVDDRLEAFAVATSQPREVARRELERLIAEGTPHNDVERDLVWNLWKEIRAV
jgi:hypothetical protein